MSVVDEDAMVMMLLLMVGWQEMVNGSWICSVQVE
jgi:hypothetical protein